MRRHQIRHPNVFGRGTFPPCRQGREFPRRNPGGAAESTADQPRKNTARQPRKVSQDHLRDAFVKGQIKNVCRTPGRASQWIGRTPESGFGAWFGSVVGLIQFAPECFSRGRFTSASQGRSPGGTPPALAVSSPRPPQNGTRRVFSAKQRAAFWLEITGRFRAANQRGFSSSGAEQRNGACLRGANSSHTRRTRLMLASK